MDFIEKILKKSYKKKNKILSYFIFSIVFILEILCLELFSITGIIVLIIIALSGVVYAVSSNIVLKLLEKNFNFFKTKMYKEIKKSGYLEKFMSTIDDEIESPEAIKYYYDIEENGLVITKTWFVIISSKRPKIRKTSEIIRVFEQANLDSKILCSFQFKDDSYINEYLEYDEIKKDIEEKYPNISLE